jgi:DNA-binding transcriptional MerR regulator
MQRDRLASRLAGIVDFGPMARQHDFGDVGNLTIGEAARALGVTKQSVRSWPPEQLPYDKVGRRGDRRYAVTDVAEYITARREGGERAAIRPATLPTYQRIHAAQQADRTIATVTKVLDAAGRDELAQRLRHARSVVNDLLNSRDD